MKIRVFIERGKDGSYGAFMPDENRLRFGAVGEGKTAEEAKNDFLAVVKAVKEQDGLVPDDLEFEFSYDIPSFLAYYSKYLTLAGLERMTGVAQGQLSHYVTGRRRPSQKTVAKIRKGLDSFSQELQHLGLL